MPDSISQGMELPFVDVRIFASGHAVVSKAVRPYINEYKVSPLPEGHGRLIDAEAFVDYMQNRYDNNEITNGDWIDFRLSLKDQPTIVPAEGGNADDSKL